MAIAHPQLTCESCARRFTPTPAQKHFIAASAAKRMTFVMLECPHCGLATALNPMGAKIPRERTPQLRCPTLRCTGYALHVSDERLYGCGECGTTWPSKAALQHAITAAVRTYPHRRGVYVRRGTQWIAKPTSREPADYDATVEQERATRSRRSASPRQRSSR